ncbi:S8 family serine peptidase [bacterium]|nr:S8 family serine peptidase [bacterium]
MKKSFVIAFFVLLLISLSISSPYSRGKLYKTGIVILRRPDNFWNDIEKIHSLDKLRRRRRAIEYLKSVNKIFIDEFRSYIPILPSGCDVIIEKGFWLGNSVKIRFSGDGTIDAIKNLPCVVDAFEDFEGFRIKGIEESADALEIVWGVNQINAPTCWDWGYTGQNVLVAVLDTGTRYTHLDLVSRMWHNEGEIEGNGIDDDGNGYIDDYYGYDTYNGDGNPWDDNAPVYHGTHCSGTVVGDGTNGSQTGVAPGAELMAVKVMGSGGTGTASALADGIQYALDNGADVLSLSLGWDNPSDDIKNFMRPIMEDVLTAGVVAACAAGNEQGDYSAPQDLDAPADCPSPWQGPGEGNSRTAVIAVGATDSYDNIASFSSYGPTHWDTGDYSDYPYPPGLMKPDICAPGVGIKSTYGSSDYNYTIKSGTSMAAPHIAGALAVLISKNPAMTPRTLDSLIQNTALPLGPAGKDSLYGSGRIRLDEAVSSAPVPSFPVIAYDDYTIDDPFGNDNGIADPGETFNMPITINNSGMDATGVYATISVSSTYITVIDSSGTYGDIATGESATNTGDPYVLQASTSVPPGYSFDVLMHITADGGYSWDDTFSVTVANYPRQTADLDIGDVIFTITNFGEVGFYDPTNSSSPGSGFVYDGYNYLFGGGLFIGFEYDDVATGENGNSSEIKPISDIQTASPGTFADQEISCSFVDPETRIRIDFLAMEWSSAPDNDFVILRYILTNLTSATISGLYMGLYLDFDINYNSGWYDRAFWSNADNWGYMWDSQSPPAHPAYVGLVGVSEIDRGSVVNNPYYVYPSGMGWADSVKYNFLSGAFSISSGDSTDDWSLIIANGALSIPADAGDTVVYAIVAGNDLSDFEANAAQARTHLGEALSIEQNIKNAPEKLNAKIYPNPFNSSCVIYAPSESDVAIYDLRGKLVWKTSSGTNAKTSGLLGNTKSNYQKVVWTPNKSLSSGIYLVKIAMKSELIKARRIVYIK